MDKVYSGYELEVNKNVEDVAYNGRMLKIEGNSKQEVIEEVKGKEVTGEFITVNDVELEDGRITVSGNSKQETRSGKNKLEFINGTYTDKNVTAVVKDGVITLNGNPSSTSFVVIDEDFNYTFKANQRYTISLNNSNIINSDEAKFRFSNGITTIKDINFNSANKKETFYFTEDTLASNITIRTGTAITYNNFVIKPQLELGETASEWEQGGASPSPDYPSEVESCGDNVNLFDGELESGNINSTGVNYVDSTMIRSKNYTKVKPNTDIVIANDETIIQSNVIEYDENYNFIAKTYVNAIKFTTNSQTNYIKFVCSPVTENKIKIEYNSKPTPHSPYGQGSINEVICNKNLIRNENIDVGDNCYWYSYSTFDKETYTMTRSTTNTTESFIAYRIGNGIIKNNTQYTISFEAKKNDYVKSFEVLFIGYNASGIRSKTIDLTKEFQKYTYTFTTDATADYKSLSQIRFDNNGSTESGKEAILTIKNVMLVEGTDTDYEEHKSQTYTIPTQQPFRAIGDIKDTFIKKNNKWYERHYIGRVIFNGTEDWALQDNGTKFGYPIRNDLKAVMQITNSPNNVTNCLSNRFVKGTQNQTSQTNSNIVAFSQWGNTQYLYVSKIKDSVAELKSYFAKNKTYVDYPLETPIDIECTEEQNAILNQLYNTTIYIPTTNIYSTGKISVINKLKYNYVLPSPSPEIPSEVESCGDNINLIDCVSINGYTKASGEIVFNASTDYLSVPDIIEVKPNTTYTIDFVGYEDGNFLVAEFDKNKTFIQRLSYSTRTFTTSSNCYYIFPYLYKSSSYNIIGTKIKMVKGTRIDGYSPYGQGCINEVICNKNLFDKRSITSGYYITSSGTLIADKTTFVSNFIKVIENEYIAITYRSNWNNIGLYDKDKNFIKRVSIGTSGIYLIPEGCEYIRVNSLITDIDILQIERDNLTDYVEHKSQAYTIPTQQPFRAIGDIRDTFIKKNNKWYERHYIPRKIFDGTENITQSIDGNGDYFYNCYISANKIWSRMLSSHFKYLNGWGDNNVEESIYWGGNGHLLTIKANIDTVDNFKSWLTAQYNAGTPVYVDYILETPLDIECTPEQEIKLEKIQNIKLYDGINYIYSLDDIEALLTFEYYYKMKDYDFYLSADGYLNIPSLGIRYLVDLNESSISTMPEAVESSVRVAGRDGDVVLNTTYEPIPFNIVCYTEDNLTAMEKTEQEIKINSFLNSIKNRTKRFAIERNTKFYEVKYNGALTTINFPKFLKFSIPFKSSDSYGKDIVENIMIGNEKVNSNTIKEVGALITIKGPAISPIIALNDYSIEYSTDIIDGARIEIDTNKSTVTHINSDEVKTNVMKYYNHQFPKIENGENELKILSGIDDNNRVNIKWNDLKL